MDFSNLQDKVSNLTLYDLKAGVRKVQNGESDLFPSGRITTASNSTSVMNYTDMEAKVREATNNEPWGASTTLMQEIANGTHSYQLLNEIMPLIYKRFTDKSAEEWRQIYKSLQLLEFLVKNGSERVVDDARSHMSLLRMLRQFHFIDMNGKDQGINVRNRSSELVKLLGDVDQIRTERKKARSNRNKFSGFEGGMGTGGGMGSSDRYGGFGSDSMGYGGYSGGVYGDGGGFGGASSDFQDTTTRRGNRFEEYDEYDEGEISSTRREPASAPAKREPKKPEPAPVADLFDFGDDELPAPTSTAAGKQPAPADDDDFDDFQSATPAAQPSAPSSSNQFSILPPASTVSTTSSTQFVAPVPVSGSQGANINGLVGFTSATPTPSSSSLASPVSQTAPMQQPMAPKPSGFQAATPNYFTSVSNIAAQPFSSHGATSSISSAAPASSAASQPAANTAKKSSGDAFGSLWSTASASAGISKSNASANKGPNLASMAKEKASAGIWGAPAASSTASTSSQPQQKQGGSAFDDLLG
ncbi:Golgi to endosome transport protein (Ent3) [Penicillium macrosclerotiorum]|uniref:Golgi to endosome transport protein (Ent3) n=1 Tax=Penicillium macrosclerotiorum TaxID=303699 RepID=UPI002548A02E|nr:Golgi to endosome transport protein (Ent3) [Penicillium macrosclerotiorum]KAJ5693165.1 Golgi to endosome transport protein (Ent3) [Penicillium macrosclerotiorum]